MTYSLCSIIICSHNRSDLLIQTVNTIIQNEDIPDDFELHIVLNACTDDSKTKLLEFQNNINRKIFIHEEARAGKSFALNHAIDVIKAEYLFFIDDDQLLKKNYLKQLENILKNNPKCRIITGFLMPAWDGSEPQWVHNPEQYRIPIRPFPEYNLGEQQKVLSDKDKIPSGGNIIVHKDVFKATGQFNEEFGPKGHNLVGGEDHEFIKRAIHSGFCIEYYPQLIQWHQILYDRMSYKYMFIKGYKRSYSATRMKHDISLKPYMFRKLFTYFSQFLLSFDKNIRMFYLVKSAAAWGEIMAAFKIADSND